MASTVFVPGTTILHDWLNDVNALTYGAPLSTGSSLIGHIDNATGAVARNVQDTLRDLKSVFDFMTPAQIADVRANTALINVTVPVQAAINSGYGILCPDGTYLTDTLYFPNSPSDTNPLGGQFIGSPRVIFKAAAANEPLFKKVATAGRAYNWQIGPFCVLPASGASSTVSAIFTSGFTGSTFNRIEGLSNGTAGFYAIFDCAAAPYLSYFNTFNNPTLVGTTGYTKAFHFNNNGAGNSGNSNANKINSPVIYNNTGLSIGIDANLTYATTIDSPWIEANSTATAIYMGVSTVITGGALEANLAHLSYAPSGNTPHHTIVNGTSLTGATTIDFATSSTANIWMNVFEVSPQTWTNTGTINGNVKIDLLDIVETPAIGITQTAGGAGVLTSNTFSVTGPYSPFTRRCTLAGRCVFTPSAAGQFEITFGPPTGWTITASSFGVLSGGIPIVSRGSITSGCTFTIAAANPVNIDYFIEFNRT
jgi:hypothetical protein